MVTSWAAVATRKRAFACWTRRKFMNRLRVVAISLELEGCLVCSERELKEKKKNKRGRSAKRILKGGW